MNVDLPSTLPLARELFLIVLLKLVLLGLIWWACFAHQPRIKGEALAEGLLSRVSASSSVASHPPRNP